MVDNICLTFPNAEADPCIAVKSTSGRHVHRDEAANGVY